MKFAWESAEVLLGINFEGMNPQDGWVNPDFSIDTKVYNRDVFGKKLLALFLKISDIESRIETCTEAESWMVRTYYDAMDCNDYDRIRDWASYQRRNYGFGIRVVNKVEPSLFGFPF